MTTREALSAVYDDDLLELLKSLGVAGRFKRGELKCAVCQDVITWENLSGIFPEGGQVKFGCTRPMCLSDVIERFNRRAS